MDIRPDDIVIRIAECLAEPRRERSGMEQFSTYTVGAVRGELVKVVGVSGWWPARAFEMVLAEPCA